LSTPKLLENAIVLLITARSRADVRSALLQHPTNKVNEAQADALIEQANEAISNAAAVDYDHELGLSLVRLDQLYQQACGAKDTRTSLAIQRERSKLLGLYGCGPINGPGTDEARNEVEEAALLELACIRGHLAALVTPAPDESTEELARRVVQLFVTSDNVKP